MVNVFDISAAQELLTGSPNEGTTVVPDEQHDPNEAGSRKGNLWDDELDEEAI